MFSIAVFVLLPMWELHYELSEWHLWCVKSMKVTEKRCSWYLKGVEGGMCYMDTASQSIYLTLSLFVSALTWPGQTHRDEIFLLLFHNSCCLYDVSPDITASWALFLPFSRLHFSSLAPALLCVFSCFNSSHHHNKSTQTPRPVWHINKWNMTNMRPFQNSQILLSSQFLIVHIVRCLLAVWLHNDLVTGQYPASGGRWFCCHSDSVEFIKASLLWLWLC